MEPQATKATKAKSYAPGWDVFYERGLEILATEPIRGRFSIKYNPKTKMCTVKVTDGRRIIMKRTNSGNEIGKVEKFAHLAVQVLTNEQKKEPAEDKHKEKEKKKDKKTKKK